MSVRGTFVIRDGKIVPKDEAGPRIELGPMSDLPCPMVMGDTMEPTQHMCDGQTYTSKSRFRAVTKAHGCIEVGNDPARFRRPKRQKTSRQQIKDTVERATARFNRGERA